MHIQRARKISEAEIRVLQAVRPSVAVVVRLRLCVAGKIRYGLFHSIKDLQ